MTVDDILGGIWEEIKKTSSDEHWPEARGYHSAVTYQDRFLIIYGGSTEADRLLEDLWVYDTSALLATAVTTTIARALSDAI